MHVSPHWLRGCDAVLANACFGRPPVQQDVSQRGGVELLLEQCQVGGAVILCAACASACCATLRADACSSLWHAGCDVSSLEQHDYSRGIPRRSMRTIRL